MNKNSEKTIMVLANAIELTSNIIYELMGEEISNTLNNNLVKKDELSQLTGMRVLSKFSKYNKG